MKYLDKLFVSAYKSSRFTSKHEIRFRAIFILSIPFFLLLLPLLYYMFDTYWIFITASMAIPFTLNFRYNKLRSEKLIIENHEVPPYICDLLSLTLLIGNIVLYKYIN